MGCGLGLTHFSIPSCASRTLEINLVCCYMGYMVSRDVMIFKGETTDVGEMVEHVKIKSWLWLSTKSPQFNYPIVCCFSNPTECLGLNVWGLGAAKDAG